MSVAVPLRVLILEDEPDDAELAVHALRQAGFEPGSPVAVQMPGSRPAASRGTARPYYPGTEEAHTNPTRQRGECLRALAGASG